MDSVRGMADTMISNSHIIVDNNIAYIDWGFISSYFTSLALERYDSKLAAYIVLADDVVRDAVKALAVPESPSTLA